MEHCGGTRWLIVQPGGEVPASVWLLFNRVGKPIIPFSDQASDLI